MDNQQLTVILTGIGAPGAYGTIFALRQGAQTANINLTIIGVDVDARFPATSFYDIFFQLPKASDPQYLAELNLIVEL